MPASAETECPILLQHGFLHRLSEIARGQVRQSQFSYHCHRQNQGNFRTLQQYRAYGFTDFDETNHTNTWVKAAKTAAALALIVLFLAGDASLSLGFPQTAPGTYGAASAGEDAFKKGRAAYDREDYPAAVEWFGKAADAGNVQALGWLGTMYLKGWGVSQSSPKALELFHKGAAQGGAFAMMKIAVMYTKGVGVPKDDAQGAIWFRKAAELGDAEAQNFLGLMYALGEGVPKDNAKAAGWLRKSADQGDAKGQANLGWMYWWGLGVPKDLKLAVALYRKAAAQGNEDAKKQLPKVEQARWARIHAKLLPSVRIECALEALRYKDVDQHTQDCLRANWKKLYPSEPFPVD